MLAKLQIERPYDMTRLPRGLSIFSKKLGPCAITMQLLAPRWHQQGAGPVREWTVKRPTKSYTGRAIKSNRSLNEWYQVRSARPISLRNQLKDGSLPELPSIVRRAVNCAGPVGDKIRKWVGSIGATMKVVKNALGECIPVWR